MVSSPLLPAGMVAKGHLSLRVWKGDNAETADLCWLLAIVHFNFSNGPGSCRDGHGINKSPARAGENGQEWEGRQPLSRQEGGEGSAKRDLQRT